MAWLWLISVGVTDVQVPVWKHGDDGGWKGPFRFDIGRGAARKVHQGLQELLERGQIYFPSGDLPHYLGREESRDLKFDFATIDDAFIATIRVTDGERETFRISAHGECIPNDIEERLPLYCPKVAEMLDAARAAFQDEPVTVVVLNTRRDETFWDSNSEPVASGPLVAAFAADRLKLSRPDDSKPGCVPKSLDLGSSTWVNILTGSEAAEDSDAQQEIVRRLTELADAWQARKDRKVMISSTGGIPLLKPILERVPATCFAQGAVQLLDVPERRGLQRREATVTPLNYGERVAEREALRFHCVTALRQRDYAGAYGLASRCREHAWARVVLDQIGPLLELPGRFDYGLQPFSMNACQVEVSLCMGDTVNALMRLARFVETTTWEVISSDARIVGMRVEIRRDKECIVGDLPRGDPMFSKGLLKYNSEGPRCHRVVGLTHQKYWTEWLNNREGNQASVASSLKKLHWAYIRYNLRDLRNRLAHGSDSPVSPEEVERSLLEAKLISGVNQPFSQNFMATPLIEKLLRGLGAWDAAKDVGRDLRELIDKVIRS